MKRREVLKVAGVTGAGLNIGLSGCIAQSTVSVDQHISSAREILLDNEGKFEGFSHQIQQGNNPTSFDVTSIKTAVSRTNEDLSEVESEANKEQLEAIKALRQWGENQIARADYLNTYVSFLDKYNTFSAYSDTQQYKQAKNALSELQELHSELESRLSEMELTYAKVNRDGLRKAGLEAYEEDIKTRIAGAKTWSDLMDLFLNGAKPMVDGQITYLDAMGSLDVGNYDRAQELFGEAEVYYAESNRVFQRLQEQNAEFTSLEANLVGLVCYTDALSDASGYMQDAIEAYQNGNNTQSEEYANKAKEAANRCGTSY